MAGIENFIKTKKEFIESYEGLKNEPALISLDGPDGVGKTEISKRVILKLQEKFKKENKDPNNIVYLKYTRLMDTNSQVNISENIKKLKDENGGWDKSRIDSVIKLWSAKLNRSYNDHVLPLLKEGKTIILDRSEIDIFRACIEWGDKDLLDKVIEYFKSGSLTHGITAGNKIFISSIEKEIYKNLTERGEPLSKNDPKSLEEMFARVKNEKIAEQLIVDVEGKEKPNVIRVENRRVENEKDRNVQFEEIAENIVNNLKF